MATPPPNPSLNRLDFWLLFLGAAFVFVLTYRAPVTYTRSDPHLSLFVSQALVQHHTITLDSYANQINRTLDGYAIRERGGHLYYYFPLAPSFFVAPFVKVANSLGWDMTVTAHNHRLQKALASFLCGVIFMLLYRLARYYVATAAALGITAVFILGTALTSTLGTALWNTSFAVLFTVLALWLLVDANAMPASPFLLGALLFAAYFSRPTTAAFILPALVYLFFRRPGKAFVKTALILALFLLLFVLFSWQLYGQFLPPYYSLQRFDRTYQVGLVLYGHLLSPSRGLLIFSPFIALVAVGVLFFYGRLKKHPLFWLCAGWVALHLAAVSHIGHWWGGHAFGPRLLAELVPAVFMLAVLLWVEMGSAPAAVRTTAVVLYLGLGFIAIFINSYQGLYNPYTAQWNATPNIDQHPQYVFDWRYPQFLASARSLSQRYQEHTEQK